MHFDCMECVCCISFGSMIWNESAQDFDSVERERDNHKHFPFWPSLDMVCKHLNYVLLVYSRQREYVLVMWNRTCCKGMQHHAQFQPKKSGNGYWNMVSLNQNNSMASWPNGVRYNISERGEHTWCWRQIETKPRDPSKVGTKMIAYDCIPKCHIKVILRT